MKYILNSNKTNKQDFNEWLENSKNRSHYVYLAWRMCLRKITYIEHEIQEWNGRQEIIFENFLLPSLRAIFVSRFIGGLGSDAQRVENYAGESVRHLDSFLYDTEAAMGTAILCNMCQRLSLLCAQDILDFRRIISDIFGLMCSIDTNDDNFFEEVFIDIAYLENGGSGSIPLFADLGRRNIFDEKLSSLSQWAETVDVNSHVWFKWIANVADHDFSLAEANRKNEIFDYVIGTKKDNWWRRKSKRINKSINNIYTEFEAGDLTSLEKYLPEWGAKRRNIIMQKEYDFFISHASEDKDKLARPLFNALEKLGFKVWFDEKEIILGDSIRASIDNGLSNSKFGVVILSEAFFQKNWTQLELDGLFAIESSGKKVILPIWLGLTFEQVLKKSPLIASKLALNSDDLSPEEQAKKIAAAFFAEK